jgi:hypothetical protein
MYSDVDSSTDYYGYNNRCKDGDLDEILVCICMDCIDYGDICGDWNTEYGGVIMIRAARMMRKTGRYMIDCSIEERMKQAYEYLEGPLDPEIFDGIIDGLNELKNNELTNMWYFINEYFEMLLDEGVVTGRN